MGVLQLNCSMFSFRHRAQCDKINQLLEANDRHVIIPNQYRKWVLNISSINRHIFTQPYILSMRYAQGGNNLLWFHDSKWVHVILMIQNEFGSKEKKLIMWTWFITILCWVVMSYTDSKRFLVSLEITLLDFRRFLRILLIFRDFFELEWFMWFFLV